MCVELELTGGSLDGGGGGTQLLLLLSKLSTYLSLCLERLRLSLNFSNRAHCLFMRKNPLI